MKISPKTIKALRIIKEGRGITPKFFAMKMWPDSPAWERVYNTGHGATTGKGLWLSAGSYLAKLRRAGLVEISFDDYHFEYWLSIKGKEALEGGYDAKSLHTR